MARRKEMGKRESWHCPRCQRAIVARLSYEALYDPSLVHEVLSDLSAGRIPQPRDGLTVEMKDLKAPAAAVRRDNTAKE